MIRTWYGRIRLGFRALQQLWTAYRRERPQINAIAVQVNLPTQPTNPQSFLREMAQIPRQIIEQEKEPQRIRRRLDETEPFLKVARTPGPQSFEWIGAATIAFPSREIAGRMTVRWNGSAVEGTIDYAAMPEADFVEISFPTPGRLRGSESYGSALIDSAGLEIDRISGNFHPIIPIGEHTANFSARSLRQGAADGAAFHRYIYRGGRLRGWRDFSERATFHERGMSFSRDRDSFDTTIFGRRARITRIQDDDVHQYSRLIGVTIAGLALDTHEQDVLWHVLSFVTGTRLQPTSNEHYGTDASLLQSEYLTSIDFGAAGTHPPFDLRLANTTFNPAAFGTLADGFSRLLKDGFPLAIALHHLYDANTGYTQVEIKNLLFCIHTLFEAWTEEHGQRYIENEKTHAHLRRQLNTQLVAIFGHDPELFESVRSAIKFSYRRVGAVLQELFFDSLSTMLSPKDLRALRKRNPLFHNGYIVPKNGQSQHEFLQELVDDAGTLRTLAHEALLKLSGYHGPFFDYRKWTDRTIS